LTPNLAFEAVDFVGFFDCGGLRELVGVIE
jgi:hypothetical protein